MHLRDVDLLPYGLGLLALGAGLATVTFGSLAEPDVSYTRSEWTALSAMLIATPALVVNVLSRRGPDDWWRAFWTAGLLAFLAHFWWAVIRTYQGDFGAIFARQGWVAGTNLLVTLLWTLDVVRAWTPRRLPRAVDVGFRWLTWTLVAVSFVAAAAVFRTGTVQQIGYALGAALVLAIVVRLINFAPAPPPAADRAAP